MNTNMVILHPNTYTVVLKLRRDPHFGVVSCTNVDIISDEELERRAGLVLELLETMIKSSKYKIRMSGIKMELAILEKENFDYRVNKKIRKSELAHLSYLETLLGLLKNDPNYYQCVRKYLLSLE